MIYSYLLVGTWEVGGRFRSNSWDFSTDIVLHRREFKVSNHHGKEYWYLFSCWKMKKEFPRIFTFLLPTFDFFFFWRFCTYKDSYFTNLIEYSHREIIIFDWEIPENELKNKNRWRRIAYRSVTRQQLEEILEDKNNLIY
jgi:hypothetical protein